VRKGISLISLAIILLNVLGFYIFFFLQITLNRQAMRERLKLLPSEQLEKMLLSADEFRKCRVDEHEVKVAGKMYDIARVQTRGDSVIVYGLHDAREDSLLTFIGFILNEPISKKEMKQIKEFLSLVYLPATTLRYCIPERQPKPDTRFVYFYRDLVTQEFFTPPRS
jgi:hypothetical protein